MLALFKSHFSIGKSILTLDDPITHKEGGADSIFSIAKENNLKEVVLVKILGTKLSFSPKTPLVVYY